MKLGLKVFDEDQNKERQKQIDILNSVASAVKFTLNENKGDEAYDILAQVAGFFACLVINKNLIRFSDPADFFEECGFDDCTCRDMTNALEGVQKEQKKKDAGKQQLMW